MKRLVLALVVGLLMNAMSVCLGQDVGTKAWRDQVEKAQSLNKEGKYQLAVDAAPLSYQKAWYSLSVLREKMGGTRDENRSWSGYSFDKKTGKFTGDSVACLKQVDVVKGCVDQAVADGYGDQVNGITDYLTKYASNIKNGLPKSNDDD